MVQIFGDKAKTDLFPLKDPSTNENEFDEFTRTECDIGRVKTNMINSRHLFKS